MVALKNYCLHDIFHSIFLVYNFPLTVITIQKNKKLQAFAICYVKMVQKPSFGITNL